MYSKYTDKKLYEVDYCAGACWFIRRHVFNAMQRPYFKIEYSDEMQKPLISDDRYFQRNAKALGFRMWTDTRYVASHYHTRDLSLV